MDGLILQGDARRIPLASGSVHCVVTSPPYWGLRNYGVDGQIGLESTPESYVAEMVGVFREVWRVLRDDGTCWLNCGDSYVTNPGNGRGGETGVLGGIAHRSGKDKSKLLGLKPKDLVGIPWRLAFALQADGWYLRSEIIWHKLSPMPESVTDRPTKAHEQVFLLTKRERYFYDAEAVKEGFADARMGNPNGGGHYSVGSGRLDHGALKTGRWNENGTATGRNLRSVWSLSSTPCNLAHFATMPLDLAARCIKAGTSERGVCATCGGPWKRVTEKDRQPTRPGQAGKVAALRNKLPSEEPGRDSGPARFEKSTLGSLIGNRDPLRHCTTSETRGWQPTCSCPDNSPVPAIVFDPFCGAATTLLAARQLGRRGVGTELNREYIHLAHQRIRAYASGRLDGPAIKPLPGQASLFA
jgi:DNA modification methylase